MLRKTFACLLVAGLAGAAVHAQTAEELIEKSLQASGGRAKMEAVKSRRMTGRVSSPQGEAPVVIEYKQPDKIRTEVTIQGKTLIQALNGEEAWMLAPMGNNGARKLSDEEVRQAREGLDSFDLLTTYKDKGYTLAYTGKEDVEGASAYKLQVTKKGGDPTYLYLDAKTYLPIQISNTIRVQGQPLKSDMVLKDYKPVDGILYPHSTEMRLDSVPGKIVTTFSKIEVNPALDNSRFAMPAEAAAPPKR